MFAMKTSKITTKTTVSTGRSLVLARLSQQV